MHGMDSGPVTYNCNTTRGDYNSTEMIRQKIKSLIVVLFDQTSYTFDHAES